MNIYDKMDSKYLEPIKSDKFNIEEWKNIKIIENNEKLISLKNIDERIIVEPQYFLNGIKGSENDCKVRENIAKKLLNIVKKLPDGFNLLVWDAFRTIETQQALFDKYYAKFKKEEKIDGKNLMEYTQKFVSLPSYDKLRPSPHNTGAAIDLTICDEDNNPINLGSYFDDFRAQAYTRYYEGKKEKCKELNIEETDILMNRRVLCNLFTEEGFANYPYEIWHKSYGDQMYSKLYNKEFAIYGGIEAVETKGEIK